MRGFFFSIEKKGPGAYRYGFNGKEQDDEIDGSGVDYDYGARIYDGRIGRFLSVDPLTPRYPELTPYQFAGNSPIANIDLDGLEPYPSIRNLDKTKSVLEHAMDESFWTRNNMLLGAAMGSLNTKPHVWWQHAHGFANNAGNRIFNNMKGVAGEAIAANAIYNTFAEHFETIQPNGTFNPTNDPDGGFDGIPGGTWDFFLNIRFVKPRPNIFTGEEPSPKAFEIVTNSNDGSSRSSTFDLSSPKNFLFEIKTNNAAAPPSLLYLNIRKGFQQAITNAKVNSKAFSILVVDQQAYQAMWNGITPLQRESITNLYNELKDLNKKNGGDGVLWLISNLEQNAKNLATKAYHEIKQNTTTETQDTSK